MPRPSKSAAKNQDSTVILGGTSWRLCGARQMVIGNPQAEREGVHPFGVALKSAEHDHANTHYQVKAQVLSKAQNNMAALPDQLPDSTQTPVSLGLNGKNKSSGKRRSASELELALAA